VINSVTQKGKRTLGVGKRREGGGETETFQETDVKKLIF